MNLKIYFLLIGLIVLTFSLVFIPNSHATTMQQDTTVTGIVTPIAWDEDDNVTATAITVTIVPEDSTEDEYSEDYVVGDTDKGLELIEHVGKQVEATGTLEIDEYANKTIYVESYRIIKD
jgi:hypothetical protein